MASNKRARKPRYTQAFAKQAYKEIAPFVSFKYKSGRKFTKKQIAKIKEYHQEVSALVNRPYQLYKSRGKNKRKNLKAVQKFAGHGKYLPELLVAFVPTDGKTKFRVSVSKKGQVRQKSKHVAIGVIELNKRALIKDAVAHVANKIANHPSENFTIAVGKGGRYEIPEGHTRQSLPNAVQQLVNNYNDKEANNYFGNWLFGLHTYEFDNQESLGGYLHEKSVEIKKQKRKRKKERARISARARHMGRG